MSFFLQKKQKKASGQNFIRELQLFSIQVMDNISDYNLNGMKLLPSNRH